MKRLFGRILLALSITLLAASLAAWQRSYFVSDQLIYTTHKPVILGVTYGQGTIDLVRATMDPSIFVETPDSLATEKPKAGWELKHEKPDQRDDWQAVPPEHQIHFLGASYRSGQLLFFYAQDITLPFWMLVLLLGIYPAIRLFHHHRRRPGHCPACGYDIRATPDRCPECGLQLTASAPAP